MTAEWDILAVVGISHRDDAEPVPASDG